MIEGQVPVDHSEYVRLVALANKVSGLEQRIAELEAENQTWEFQIALVNKNRNELREEAQWMEQCIVALRSLANNMIDYLTKVGAVHTAKHYGVELRRIMESDNGELIARNERKVVK